MEVSERKTGKRFARITEFFKGNRLWFFVFAVLSLAIPDLVLKSKVIFIDFKVDGSEDLKTFLCDVVPLIFSALWIGFIMFLSIWVLPKRAGRITFVVIAALADILMISEFIYYTMFGRFFMLSSIFLANEGAAYLSILHQYISPWLILYTVLAVGSLIMTCICWQKQVIKKRFWCLGLVFILLVAYMSTYMTASAEEKKDTKIWSNWMAPKHVYSDMADPDRCIRIMGIYQFMVRSVTYPLFTDTGFKEEDYRKVDEFVKHKEEIIREAPVENEMTGYFKDKNLIVIMLESVDDWMISEETTPTLYRLRKEGMNFDAHIATPFGGGFTFNSEFAFNTGYYTPKSTSSASIYGYNAFPNTLPKLFSEKGYSANQFHYNKKEFYNRSTMHKAFGYEDYISFMDYMSEEEAELDSNSMLLPEEDIYKKMTENPKFFDYVITYSAHLPYGSDDKIDAAKEKYPELVDKVTVEEFKAMMLEADEMSEEIDYSEFDEDDWQKYTGEYNNARLLAKDTDEFVRLLVEKLERDGLMEDTVLVFFADHYTYGYSNEQVVKGMSLLDGEKFVEETPFFIYHKGSPPMTITKASSTKDILPTIQNLFGLRWFGGYIGDDIFDPTNTGFVYFSNMTWYDGEIYRDDKFVITEENREYIEAMDQKMMECVNLNDIIIAGDYFARKK